MENSLSNTKTDSRRLGFHYYPDTDHYTKRDLQAWLPVLTGLNTGWLVLKADDKRAIPDYFLFGLMNAGIQPILDFSLSMDSLDIHTDDQDPLFTLLNAYLDWGIRYFNFFDRPNQRSSWPAASWAQQDLVERFLDRFIPLAEQVAKKGGAPMLPALEPGGSFWDTAFLRLTLQSLERRKKDELLESLVLTAYGYTYNHSLDWGLGGPERWPDVRPYFTPAQSQDQRGFRIVDWYNAISMAVIQHQLPIILLQAGLPGRPDTLSVSDLLSDPVNDQFKAVFYLASGTAATPDPMKPQDPAKKPNELPDNVLACNLYVLAATPQSAQSAYAWFDGKTGLLPAAKEIAEEYFPPSEEETKVGVLNEGFFKKASHPIKHYLLIPADQLLGLDKQIRTALPYIQKHQMTVGFSLDEAQMAERVTILADKNKFARESVVRLQRKGCQIYWMSKLA